MKPSYVLSNINTIAQDFTAFSQPVRFKSYALVSVFWHQYDSTMKIQPCVKTKIVRNKALKICTNLDLITHNILHNGTIK